MKEAKLDLGAEKIDIDVRVKMMEDACEDLRHQRFFLKALELKEKEKNLLAKYGIDIERSVRYHILL